METIITILKLQVTLLLLIAVGAAGRKRNIITEGFTSGLSGFLMNIILPCSVFGAFLNETGGDVRSQTMQILLVMVGVHLLYIAIGWIVYRRAAPDRRAILRFAVLCPNSSFMGMPVIGGIYGDLGILLLSVALLPVRVFIMTVGISYFLVGGSAGWYKGLLKNPSLWAVILGFIVSELNMPIWGPLADTITYLGRCNTPLAMILIGTTVATFRRDMLREKTIWRFCAMRLIIIPLIVLALLLPFDIDATVAGVVVTVSALPAGAMTVIFAQSYKKDGEFAAACVIVSTLLSTLTVPIINIISSQFLK